MATKKKMKQEDKTSFDIWMEEPNNKNFIRDVKKSWAKYGQANTIREIWNIAYAFGIRDAMNIKNLEDQILNDFVDIGSGKKEPENV